MALKNGLKNSSDIIINNNNNNSDNNGPGEGPPPLPAAGGLGRKLRKGSDRIDRPDPANTVS
jgi:hypothetical protein